MRNKLFIIGTLLVIGLAFGACAPPGEPAPVQPSQDQLSFVLSTNTTPGNTDEYDSWSFPIYLEPGQELYLSFYAEGASVMFSVITPSEEGWGYETSSGRAAIKDEGLGRLERGRTKAAEEGHFRFSPSEPGYYLMIVKSSTPQGEIDVLVEYEISAIANS
jgi:hypothetical protein